MAEHSTIEWTNATWNPITGCSVVSPGCTNCYAMRLAGTRLKHHPSRAGLTRETKAGPVWTGAVRFNEQWLGQPLRWARPRMIFVCAHGDLFAGGVTDEWLDQIFAVMALAHWHTFQVLTKRPERMRAYLTAKVRSDPAGHRANNDRRSAIYAWLAGNASQPHFNGGFDASPHHVAAAMDRLYKGGWPLPNVWLGISAEDQRRADERVPVLLDTPAAVRWVSAEPLLGPIDFRWIAEPDDAKDGVIDALLGCNWIDGAGRGETFRPFRPGHTDREMTRRVVSGEKDILSNRKLDWIVAGGESGPGSRPMHPAWVRAIRDQCAAAGVAFNFKQWGNWFPHFKQRPHQVGRRVESAIAGKRPAVLFDVGKTKAGRLLDGIEHNGFPVIQSSPQAQGQAADGASAPPRPERRAKPGSVRTKS